MVKIAACLVRCAVKLDCRNEVKNFLVHAAKVRFYFGFFMGFLFFGVKEDHAVWKRNLRSFNGTVTALRLCTPAGISRRKHNDLS